MVLGHSFEIFLIAKKDKKYFRGHYLYSDNICIGPAKYYQREDGWNLVVYSYNNPTKINTHIGFTIIDKM